MPIDYREIPEVKEQIEHLEKMSQSKDRLDKMIGETLLSKNGREMTLHVEVTDPRLFQIVLGSMYSNDAPLSVPGAKIVMADLNNRQVVRNWLQERINEIDSTQ